MNTVVILEKLLDIDRALGREDTTVIRKKIIEAQDCVLNMQKAQAESLRIGSVRVALR
jgi:hypothetical protein